MSKDSNKNLDDFFRNSLKNYSENPSNDLWDRIEQNIPPKPVRKFRPAYALLALLLLLLIGFGYEYFRFNNRIVSLNETVTDQKQELESLKNQIEVLKQELEIVSQAPDNELVVENESQAAASVDNSWNFINKTEKSNPENSAAVKLDPIQSNESVVIIPAKEEVLAEEKITVQPIPKVESTMGQKLTTEIDFLKSKPVFLENDIEKELPLLAVSSKREGKAFSIELYSSIMKTFPNSSKTSESKIKVKNWQPSFDIGTLFNLGLSKRLDVQIGVGYNRMVINDAFATELIYARDEYDQGRNTYTSAYNYTVDTPAGEMEFNSALSNRRENDGRDLEEGDPFRLDLQYTDEIHYFQVPVFVRYKMGSGKFRFTVKGGFIQKFLLDETIKVNSVNPEFDRLENDMTHLLGNQTTASTTSVDALIGAGAECRLSHRSSVHLQSIFSHSLQEIYPGMKPYSVGLQFGFQHQIGK